MNTEITKNAKAEYKSAGKEQKKLLEKIFGKNFFSEIWVGLWEKFCKENKLTIVLPYSNPSNPDEESANAYFMLIHIIRIKNNGWKPDWNDSSQYKYYPWFDMRTNSGSRFSCGDYGIWFTYSYVGSRLCFKSEKLAKDTAKEFLPIYEKYICE